MVKTDSIQNQLMKYMFFSVCFILFNTINVHAYIDPSVMTYAIQAIAGVLIGLGAFFGIYFRRLKRLLNKQFNFETASEVESDDLYFMDPDTGEKRFARVNAIADKHAPVSRSEHETFIPAFLLCLAFSFMVGVYAPLEIYLTNKNEFWFDFYQLAPQITGMFFFNAVILLACCYAVYKISKKWYKRLLALGFGIYTVSYIQGNYLSGNLPALDGSPIQWSLYLKDMMFSFLLLFIVMMLVYLVFKKGYRFLSAFVTAGSLLITGMLFSSAVVLGLQNNILDRKNYRFASSEHLYDVSEKNYIIFMLDTIDSAEFRQFMEGDHKEYKEIFEDFTYYPNTVCAYSFTEYSVPFIVSGKWFEYQTDFRDYSTEAFKSAPLLNSLEANNYQMYFYDNDFVYDDEGIFRFSNINEEPYKATSFFSFMNLENSLTWFRYAPYYLKGLLDISIKDFNQIKMFASGKELFSWENRDFLDGLETHDTTVAEGSSFRWIHLRGAHSPYNMDSEANPISRDEGSYELNLEAAVTTVQRYLERLKSTGTYDNSVVIILADHGFEITGDTRLRQNALLLIKGIDDHHEMNVSEAPISYADLNDAYERLISGLPGEEAFDIPEDAVRARRYLDYTLTSPEIYESYQHGYARDLETFEYTGVVYK